MTRATLLCGLACLILAIRAVYIAGTSTREATVVMLCLFGAMVLTTITAEQDKGKCQWK
jgi:hypothetical protein